MTNRIGFVPASSLYIDIPEANKVYTLPVTCSYAPRSGVERFQVFAGQKD